MFFFAFTFINCFEKMDKWQKISRQWKSECVGGEGEWTKHQ